MIVDPNPDSCAILEHYLQAQGHRVVVKQQLDEVEAHLEQMASDTHHWLIDSRLLMGNGAKRLQTLVGKAPPGLGLVILIANRLQEHVYLSTASVLKPHAILHKPIWRSVLARALDRHPSATDTLLDARLPEKKAIDYMQQVLQGRQVLLVEDVAINQQIAKAFLRKAGVEVVLANDGQEAVDWVKKKHFDIVLMDLQMPVMDGFEATRQIRQLPQGQHLPIIAMTAAAMQHDREACIKADIDDHLPKPLNSQRLLDALLRWTQSGRSSKPQQDQ